MREKRSWEQIKEDNTGAAWIVNGEFCLNYKRNSRNGDVNIFLEQDRKAGLLEWQLPGFNGCWSCVRMTDCQLYKATSDVQ